MDYLSCARSVRFVKRNGKDVSLRIPKPNLTAPSSPERTVAPEITKVSILNLNFLEDINSLVPSKTEYNDKELYKYLYQLFSKFLDKDKISSVLNKESMKLWRKCFTHVTYDPNDNYETLESVGDKIMSYTFKTLLFQKFPDITASELNNLDQHYMSTHLQSMVAAKMGLSNWLRVRGEVPKTSEKIREDLLEAFFGAIDTIMIRSYGLGYGARICMKFLEKLFDIDLNRDIEPAKTFVKQVFERLGARDGVTSVIEQVEIQKEDVEQELFGWKVTVTINEEGLEMLRKYGKDLGRTPKQWSVIKQTKKPADLAAYTEVMYYLLSKGINVKWAQRIKQDMLIDTQIGRDTYKMILSKAQRINSDIRRIEVAEVYASNPAKTVFQILGITDSKKIVLETHSSYEDKMTGFSSVIEKFLRK